MPLPTRLLLLLAITLPWSCLSPSLNGSVLYGRAELGGGIRSGSTPGSGSNSWDQLGLGDSESALGAAFNAEWGISHLAVSVRQSHFNGTGSITSELEIDGDTISVGSDVDSDLEFGQTSALMTWDLAPTNFDLAVGLGLVVLDLEMELVDELTETRVATDEALPIPVLAARLGLTRGPWEATATLAGLDIDVDDTAVSFFDLDAQGRYHLVEGVNRLEAYLTFGYRATDLDIEDDQTQMGLDLTGPYLGLRISF